jgi:hypothetical protein
MNLLLAVLLLFCVYLKCFVYCRFSYLSPGSWKNATSVSCDHYMCSGNKLTWLPSADPHFKYYFHQEACDALIAKKIKEIRFHGDSYMRQMYSAMLITLSGDYRYGSVSNSTKFPRCEYHGQFSEKHCGLKELQYNGTTCNGKIFLDPALNGINDLQSCNPGTVLLWSFGNHKLSRYGRYGTNNATAYQLSFHDICNKIRSESSKVDGHVSDKCSVWWVSTHARIRTIFEDETPEHVRNFNEGMREFFENKKNCGETNYVDVYNMTNSLVIPEIIEEARKMSYDLVHWGMEVNLIKAQIILNALLQSP